MKGESTEYVEHDHELDLETKSHSLAGMCTETVAESPPLVCCEMLYAHFFGVTSPLQQTAWLNLSILIPVGVRAFHGSGWLAIVHFGSVPVGRLVVVFLSALKPPRRVLDSTHLDHTARPRWVDRHAPYSPVPVLNSNSSPPRWAEWWRDRSCSSRMKSGLKLAFSSTVGGDDTALLPQADASRAFSLTVVLTCSG